MAMFHPHLLKDVTSLLVLTGFRATGKTAVGRCLAELVGFAFVDTDEEICQRLGCSVAEIVEQQGWKVFREQERQVLRDLPSWSQTVVAVGGGAILHHQEWQALRPYAWIVWLRTDFQTTLNRLSKEKRNQRPALYQHQDLSGETALLLAEREPLYRAGSDMLVDTEQQRPEELAVRLWQRWKELRPF